MKDLRVTSRQAFLGLFILLGASAFGQRFYFDNFSVQEGLAASKVYDLLQDSSGYVWIGNEAGISRFDGANFENFTANDSLAPNGVKALAQDQSGRIWCGHLGGGVSVKEGYQFRALDVAAFDLANDVTAILEDAQGHIWVATAGSGVLRIKAGPDGPMEHITGEEGLSDRVFDMALTRDGTLHFITDVGIKVHRPATDDFDFLNNEQLPKYFQVTTMYEDSKGVQWFGTYNGGLYRYDPGSNDFDDFDIQDGLSSNFIMSIAEDRFGNIWVGTWDGGINRFNKKDFSIFDQSNGLHDPSVRCILEDREGNILLGTNDNGLDIFKGEQFISVDLGESREMVSAVDVDPDGRIWIGTEDGLCVYNPKAGDTERLKVFTAEESAFTNNKILALAVDERGHVWFETPAGLYEHLPGTKRFNKLDIGGFFVSNISCMATMGNDLWLGTPDGLIQFNYRTGSNSTLTQLDGLASSNISALHIDKEGTVWVGSRVKGISRLDESGASLVPLGMNFTPVDLTTDQQGRLWVATEGQGVLVLEKGKLEHTYNVASGLLSNSIRSLQADAKGNIWIGTNKGLNKFDAERQQIYAYTERAGFTGIEAKRNASCMDQKGNLWFGTAHGAVMMNSAFDLVNTTEPITNITGIKVNLTDRELKSYLDLSYKERSLIFEYGSICISDPDAIRYQYKMEGLDEDWQPVTTMEFANYNSLPPGDYVFQVRSRNNAGIWSTPTGYEFRIDPPWWMTWWFFVSITVFAALSIYGYIKFREKRLKRENRILEEKVERRTEKIAEQKDEIEDLLLNILPKEVSDELKEKGKATARDYELVSVLFTDFKGFTQIAERLSPEELVKELDDCFRVFDDIIGKYGLEKIKTIGDAYMCAGGIPAKDQNNPLLITSAAIEIRDYMKRLKNDKAAKNEPYWELRIGIHTGPLIAGVVGKKKFAYDIWGDTVNTASRMESSGVVGEVNVSGTTYALIKDHFECEYRGKVEAKNKGEIDMYLVKDPKEGYANAEQILSAVAEL